MRSLRAGIFISRNEMTINNFVETILFVINKIIDYNSSLNKVTPTLFDQKKICQK